MNKQLNTVMRQFLMTVILLTAGLARGQSFEGTLTYVSDFELADNLKKLGLTKEQLVNKMKEKGSYSNTISISYRQGNYYTLLNPNPKSWAIYTAATNRIYSMKDGDASDVCTVTDASVDLEFTMTGKMPTVVKLDTTSVVNGVVCNIVRVEWGSGTYDYYYSSGTLRVDPTLYSKHIYDGWAEFLKISKALPLRIVKKTNGMMTITLTMVSSKSEAIDEKLFSIPKLVPDKDLNIIKIANSEVMRIKK